MRTVPTDYGAALSAAPTDGLVEREIVTIFGLNPLDNSSVEYCFWNDIATVTANVVDGDTGATVSRDMVGDGALISVGDVPNVNDLSIRRVQVVLNPSHEAVAAMLASSRIRLVRAEIHRALFDPETFNLADTPLCHFIGQVSMAPIDTPAAGDEGGITLDIVSDTAELTRTNPAKRSHETQQRRSNDDAMQYVSQVQTIKLAWGEANA